MPKITPEVLLDLKREISKNNTTFLDPVAKYEYESAIRYLDELIKNPQANPENVEKALVRFFKIRSVYISPDKTPIEAVRQILIKNEIYNPTTLTEEENVLGEIIKEILRGIMFSSLRPKSIWRLEKNAYELEMDEKHFDHASIEDPQTAIPHLLSLYPQANTREVYEDFSLVDLALKNGMQGLLIILLKQTGYFEKACDFALNNDEMMCFLLSNWHGELTYKNKYGGGLLHIAAENKLIKAASLLVRDKALINLRDTFLVTPLHIAAQNGFLPMVKLLVEEGANPNLIDISKNTALSLASGQGKSEGYTEIVAVLLPRMTPEAINAKTSENRTALGWAVYKTQARIVRLFVLHMDADISESCKHMDQYAGEVSLEKFSELMNWLAVVNAFKIRNAERVVTNLAVNGTNSDISSAVQHPFLPSVERYGGLAENKRRKLENSCFF